FFTRCQWGEFDTALYELERCWGKTPSSPSPIGSGLRPRTERTIRSLADVQVAVKHYVNAIPFSSSLVSASRRPLSNKRTPGRMRAVRSPAFVLSTATHLSTDIDYRLVGDDEMEAALMRRAEAGPAERDLYASYINEAFLRALEQHGDRIAFQFSLGAE